MGEKPLVTIVILSQNTLEYTKVCIESIKNAATSIPYELVIVDNGSYKKTREYLSEIEAIKYFSKSNLGVAGGRNKGFSLSSNAAEFVCFLDNDTVVPDFWLDDLVETMHQDITIGIVGVSSNVRSMKAEGFSKDLRTEWFNFCKKYPDHTPNEQLEKFYPEGFFRFASEVRNNSSLRQFEVQMPPDYIPGWCQFIRKKALSHLPTPYDSQFPSYSSSDIDLAWSIGKNEYKAVYNEKVFIHHFKGRSAIARNPQVLAKDALTGYAILSKKWCAEIITYLSSGLSTKPKDMPYVSGAMVQYLVQSFRFFVGGNGEWQMDKGRVNRVLSRKI